MFFFLYIPEVIDIFTLKILFYFAEHIFHLQFLLFYTWRNTKGTENCLKEKEIAYGKHAFLNGRREMFNGKIEWINGKRHF